MSLVADYSDSSDSDAETPVVVAPAAVVAAPCKAKPIALPSADDLFAGTVKPSSVSAGPSFLVQRPTPKPTKRALDEPTVAAPTKNAKVKTRSLLPPQLRNRRPNVSTEDLRYSALFPDVFFEPLDDPFFVLVHGTRGKP